MSVILILTGIILSTFAVVGWLLYALKKQASSSVEEAAVPITNVEEIKASAAPLQEEKVSAPADVLPEEAVQPPRERDEDILSHLKAENAAFAAQLQAGSSETVKLSQELDAVRRELGEQALKATDAIAHLEAENARLKAEGSASIEQEKVVAEIRVEYQKQLEALYNEVASLKSDNEAMKASQAAQSEKVSAHPFLNAEAVEAFKEDMEVLRQDRVRLESRIEELEESARGEQENSGFLQYELTKRRAQAVGVERIGDYARRQFEAMSREARDAEQDNAVLKKQANVLERGLMDFKRLNSELLKREKLTQFELEHNRTQIKDLEHIYEVFRARLESAGVSVDPSAIKS